MKMHLLISVFIMIAVSMIGCSSDSSYCCTTNDLCLESKGRPTSCSMAECGHCELVEPLQINFTEWKDATVGTAYEMRLEASGGLTPYTWELTRSDETNLSWLTILWAGDNNEIGILKNKEGEYPAIPTTGDGIGLKVTLKDGSRHGTDVRIDNSGVSIEENLKIYDCERPCVYGGPTKCDLGILYHCELGYGDCTEWIQTQGECISKLCQSRGSNANVNCCVNQCAQIGDDRKCIANGVENAYIVACTEDAQTGCLVWGSTSVKTCNNKFCTTDGKSCGECAISCTPDLSECVDEYTKRICGFDENQCPVWTSVYCDSPKICIEIDGTCKCPGCWDGLQCQLGTSDTYKCGISGVDCIACTDDSSTHCGDENDANWKGCINSECVYRYTIQNGEVYDKKTNLYWKRQIEGTFDWATAMNKCIAPYYLPTITQLQAIIERGHNLPYINTCAFPFPDNPPDCNKSPYCMLWSSTTLECCSGNAYVLNTRTGATGSPIKDQTYYVRCVRNAQ